MTRKDFSAEVARLREEVPAGDTRLGARLGQHRADAVKEYLASAGGLERQH